jgi:glycerophosphoryl diester phosphodiesterase
VNHRSTGHLTYKDRSVLLKYHRLLDGVHPHPPNSLAALHQILADGPEAIEFDISLTKDGAFVLLHDSSLERETTGRGLLREITEGQFKALRLRDSDEPAATLDDAVAALRGVDRPLKVQADLTEQEPLPGEIAARLVQMLARLRENSGLRVVVGSTADWNLRILRRLDPTLALGFDFASYLDAPVDSLARLPIRINAYGYLDDHPLGYRRLMSSGAYLEDRVDVLLGLLPGACEFYLRKEFVLQALADGFNPVRFVHQRKPGVLVDIWTLNASDPDFARAFQAVLEAGADQVTTDTPARLAEFAARDG